jgi:phosphate-selective porin OprO/OprP
MALLVVLVWTGSALAQNCDQLPNDVPGTDLLPPMKPMTPEKPKEQPADEADPHAEELPAPRKKKRIQLDATWDHGFRLYSVDEDFKVHVGGNAQVDSVWLIGPKGVFAIPGGGQNGVENASAVILRRARFRLDGSIYDQFDYMVEYDFANANNENEGLQPASFGNLSNSPIPCNVWMQIRDLPWFGNVRIGNQVKPIGMTTNTYQGFLPFLERADNMDAFYGPFDGGFALGITSRNYSESERMTWQYGIYGPAINVFGVSLNKFSYGGRITGLPWYEDEGRRLMHLGLGFFAGELEESNLRVRARPLLRNGPGFAVPVLVDTGQIPGSRQYTIGPEFAMVLGPVTIQAEWAGQFLTDASVSNVPQGTVFFEGGYIEALTFLTGEYQKYERKEGVFGRVVPLDNFHVMKSDPSHRTCGAWQVGVRFSYLDCNDKAIQGGTIYDWTVGLNWFLNPNMKFQLNYIAEHRDGQQDVGHGWINGIGLRAAYDF